ncbi:MAG TPA: hypothetical protein VL981_01820 [Candidatus Methylacidiphilales bacterium]|nr:hypothetical protein [Candidatus Methylacidiphilales bacterium]
MKLWASLVKMLQSVNSTTHSPVLAYITRERVKEIESFPQNGNTGQFVRSCIRDIKEKAEKCATRIDDIDLQMALKDRFAELLMFVRLSGKCSIEKVPETTKKTPDFRVHGYGSLFIEFKALSFVDGAFNYRNAMLEALDNKIEMESKVKAGARVAVTAQTIQPFLKSGREKRYDPRSISMAVEALIDKIVQNIKPEQLTHGPTLLLVDLEQFALPARNNELLARELFSVVSDEWHSGVLWHVAFGRAGMQLKKMVDFKGLDTSDKPLERDGVLWKYPRLQGLIVSYRDRFLGLALRRKSNINIIQFVEQICSDSVFESEQS